MPELYSDDNGNRVIIRHIGPAGAGFPSGGTTGQILAKTSDTNFDATWVNPPDGTDAVNGPASATNNAVAQFNGTTGKLIKDSGIPLSSLATTSQLDTKVDKVTGNGLSQNSFTDSQRDKLDAIQSSSGFRGVFGSIGEIGSFSFDPPARAGDYCVIEAAVTDPVLVIWDATNLTWYELPGDADGLTGQEIADLVFNTTDAAAWDIDDSNVFTDAYRDLLDSIEDFADSLPAFSAPAYGGLSYVNTTGVTVVLPSISNGISNMVKIAPVSTMNSLSSGLTNGGSNNGSLHYTGSDAQVFRVSASVTLAGTASNNLVVGIAKNGVIQPETRVFTQITSGPTDVSVTLSGIMSLAETDSLEVHVGNMTGGINVTAKVLNIHANSILS